MLGAKKRQYRPLEIKFDRPSSAGEEAQVNGCVSPSAVDDLVFIDKIMDQHVFLNILRTHLEVSVTKLGLGVTLSFIMMTPCKYEKVKKML